MYNNAYTVVKSRRYRSTVHGIVAYFSFLYGRRDEEERVRGGAGVL